MANELVLKTDFSDPYLLNHEKEKEIKVCLNVMPSEEIRKKLADVVLGNQGVDVCIVLDVSGSMYEIIDGEVKQTGRKEVIDGKTYNIVEGGTSKLDVALDAVRKVVNMLRENDTISFIAYDDNPHIIFQNYLGSNKEAILSKLDECRKFEGNTNISAALREARQILRQSSAGKTKKVIFLTDGIPYGDTEENGIREGDYLANDNISVDCLGFGNEINFSFLEKVAAPSKGRTNIIKDGQDAEKMFTELFKKSQEVIVTNAKLKLSFSKNIRVTDHYRGTPENMYLGKVKLNEDREFKMNLSQIEKNQMYKYYFAIKVPSLPEYSGPFRIMKAELEYYVPALYGQEPTKTVQNVIIEYGDNPKYLMKNGEVENGYALAMIKRLQDEADQAKESKEGAKVVNRFEEIIKIYERLNMPNELKLHRKLLEEYKNTGDISRQAINEARNSSSKAGPGGLLNEIMTEEELNELKPNVRRRRRR